LLIFLQMQQQAGASQQPRETSPDMSPTSSERPAKRRRVVREKVSRHIRAFLDLAAEEEDEEGEQRKNDDGSDDDDDDDEDGEERFSASNRQYYAYGVIFTPYI
jgi:hypothetical protein